MHELCIFEIIVHTLDGAFQFSRTDLNSECSKKDASEHTLQAVFSVQRCFPIYSVARGCGIGKEMIAAEPLERGENSKRACFQEYKKRKRTSELFLFRMFLFQLFIHEGLLFVASV